LTKKINTTAESRDKHHTNNHWKRKQKEKHTILLPGHVKEDAHHFLCLAAPLGGQGRGRHVEKGSVALTRHCLGQQRLACVEQERSTVRWMTSKKVRGK